MQRLKDWTGTVLFALCFGTTLLVFDVVLRLVTPFGRRILERTGVLLQQALVLVYRSGGISTHLERAPSVAPDVPYILLSNHQSMFDIPLFAWAMPDNCPKYISKSSLAHWIPAISYNLRHGGHALIDRRDRNSSVEAIRKLARAVVQDGSSVVIFPEGTRGRDGTLQHFKQAGSLALLEDAPEAPVIPVCIDNSWRIMKNNFLPVPFGIDLRIWIGEPIARHPGEDRGALIQRAEEEIAAALKRFRNEGKPA